MSVKTVTIKQEAYNALKAQKKGNESFSDVITRIAGKPPIESFLGALSKKSADKLEQTIRETRKKRNMLHALRTKRIMNELNG